MGRPNPEARTVYKEASQSSLFLYSRFVIRLVLCSRIHDITDRLKAEKELAKSKRVWEKTFNAMSDIVTIQDENMRIWHVNLVQSARAEPASETQVSGSLDRRRADR